MFAEPPVFDRFAPVESTRSDWWRPIWQRWDALIGFGVLIGSLVFIWILAAALLLGFDLSGTSEDYTLAILGLGYEVMFAGWVLLMARQRGLSLAVLGFRRPDRWGPLGIAVVGAYASLLAWGAFVTLLEELGVDTSWISGGNEIPIDSDLDALPLAGLLVLFGLAVVIVAPLAEELLFRGLIYRALDGVWAGWAAIVVSGVAFGAFHLNLSVLLPFSVIGMLFAWAFKASGSLWVTVVAHFIINSLSYIVTVITVTGVFD